MRLTWPLTGRSEELRRIEAALSTPDVSGVLVTGEMGVGKSRIAREAMSAAQSRGCEIRHAVGTSSARSVPLGTFAAWTPPGVTETVALLRGVITALTQTPTGAPVVIVVDDAHLLDDLSAFVVHQIVQRAAAKVILTVSARKPAPTAIHEICKVGQFDRLHLPALPREDTLALVAAALGGPVDPPSAHRLWELTRGNALYLCHIVEQEIADERVEFRRGAWRWVDDPAMPPGLVELIESRIGDLPTAVAHVIDTLAVGEPIGLSMLSRITAPGAVEDADIGGLLALTRTAAGIDVRLAHPIYGEVRRRTAPETTLRRLRGLVATELARCADRDEMQVLVRRATLSVDSDLPADAELLTGAARGAVWLADLGLAEKLAEAAARAGAGPEALFIRAHALSWLGRGEQADATLATVDSPELPDEQRARLAFLRASNALWALGDPPRAKELVDRAGHGVSPQNRGYIDAFRTVYWFAMDLPEAALAASAQLVPDHLPAVVGAELGWVLSTVHAEAGRTAAAVDAAESGYRAADVSFDAPHMRFNIADAHVTALLFAGRVRDALAVAQRVQQQSAELPGAAQLLGAAVAGRAALGAGELRAASELLDQSAVGFAATHALGWGFRYHFPHAMVLAMCGRVDEAADILAAFADTRRPFRALDHEQSLARAWVCAGQGALGEAIGILLSAAERASALGRLAAEVVCLQTAVQFGDRTSAARLHELAALVEGPRAALAARLADAVHDRDPGEMSSLAQEFEHMGDVVAAVDADAHAALVYRDRGLRGSALACLARASALAEKSGASTPLLRRVNAPLPLTDREREIVMLIGEKLHSRDIAARLTLSVRTVESHIYRAMSKTGTTTREELAALLRPRDEPGTAPQ